MDNIKTIRFLEIFQYYSLLDINYKGILFYEGNSFFGSVDGEMMERLVRFTMLEQGEIYYRLDGKYPLHTWSSLTMLSF